MPIHSVAQGECVNSIAAAYGFTSDTIWNHSENASLKQTRKDRNVLLPGDQLFIPDLAPKQVSCATDQIHKFVLKTERVHIKLRLLEQDKPRAGVPYSLQIDGVSNSGVTDGDGYLTQSISPGAQMGQLLVGSGATKDVFQLQLGSLDPIDTDSGAAGRLLNLGFGTDDLPKAISAFQQKEGLPVTGLSDSATQDRLKEKFGQ